MLNEADDLSHPVTRMRAIPERQVLEHLAALGTTVLEVRGETFAAGDVESRTYFLTRPGS